MKSKYLLPYIILSVFVLLQTFLIPLISINFFRPDILLIVIGYFTLKYGRNYGMIFGFIGGFLFDLLNHGIFGSSMFTYTIFSFVIGFFYNENGVEKNIHTLVFPLWIIISSLIALYVKAVIIPEEVESGFLVKFVDYSFSPALYTSVLSLITILFRSEKELI